MYYDSMSTRPALTRELLETFWKAELIDIILTQEQRIAGLEERLGMNSQNSSKPPSSDGPDVPPPPSKKGTGKKRGAQPGHMGHIRRFLPPEMLTEVVEHKPDVCRCCGKRLSGDDPNPSRHQLWELPPLAPMVTEHRFHSLRCGCGALTTAKSAAVVREGMFGPNLTALAALLTGAFYLSRRSAVEMLDSVFNCPMSIGGLSSCEESVSNALAAPAGEIREAVLSSVVVHADETGFRLGNRKKGWLWVAVGSGLAFFLLQAKRGIAGATALLGSFRGVLVSDRWGGYNRHAGQRQYCWAHVKRDFTRISEMPGAAGKIGQSLLEAEFELFSYWHRVRDGTMQREYFRRKVKVIRRTVKELLQRGAVDSLQCSGMCGELLRSEHRLWTFARIVGVEPTNNVAERCIRPAVLWRKTSFGVQSERGAQFVERMLTVRASCRMQDKNVVDFIKNAIRAIKTGEQMPSLIPDKLHAAAAT